MAGIRKIIEQMAEPSRFSGLKFYCDWVLHHKMKGPPAQGIIRVLDCIYNFMAVGERAPPHSEASRLIKFELLKDELSAFLLEFGLDNFTAKTNQWVIFIYLYSKVVEDCPLVMPTQVGGDIRQISIKRDTANQQIDDHLPYKVNWIFDAGEKLSPATYFILNTYSVDEFGKL